MRYVDLISTFVIRSELCLYEKEAWDQTMHLKRQYQNVRIPGNHKHSSEERLMKSLGEEVLNVFTRITKQQQINKLKNLLFNLMTRNNRNVVSCFGSSFSLTLISVEKIYVGKDQRSSDQQLHYLSITHKYVIKQFGTGTKDTKLHFKFLLMH